MSLRVYPSQGAVANNTSGSEEAHPLYVMPSLYLHGSEPLPAGLLPVRYEFSGGTTSVRLYARLNDMRFNVGDSNVTTSNNSGHWLPKNSSFTFNLKDTDTHLAVVRSHLAVSDGVLEVTEFTNSP